jgi:translation initiation factor 1 (eIF-1/SUI1)
MNPFDNVTEESSEFTIVSNKKQTIPIEINEGRAKGRKMQTVVKNWDLSKDELKIKVKDFAKKNGCRGTIKTDDDGDFIVSFSGEKKYEVKQYLISKCEIPKDLIRMD